MSQNWKIVDIEPDAHLDWVGLCDPTDYTISIVSHQREEATSITLLHELFHVMEKTLHLDLSEEVVDTLAVSTYHLFKSNPDLLERIYGSTKKN